MDRQVEMQNGTKLVLDFQMDEPNNGNCPLCGRLLAGPCTRHHLVPVSEGGKGTTTVLLHKICHDKIHRVFTEKELKRKYFTIDLIHSHPSIREFVKWIQKKEPEYYDRSFREKR